MKKILVFAVMLSLLTGCKTYKTKMSQATNEPIATKLGNLKYEFTASNIEGGNYQFVDNIVRNEVVKNIIEEDEGEVIGEIKVNCKKMTIKQNKGLPFLSGLTLFTLNFLGMPFTTGSAAIDLEFVIKDMNSSTIKKYSYSELLLSGKL